MLLSIEESKTFPYFQPIQSIWDGDLVAEATKWGWEDWSDRNASEALGRYFESGDRQYEELGLHLDSIKYFSVKHMNDETWNFEDETEPTYYEADGEQELL